MEAYVLRILRQDHSHRPTIRNSFFITHFWENVFNYLRSMQKFYLNNVKRDLILFEEAMKNMKRKQFYKNILNISFQKY